MNRLAIWILGLMTSVAAAAQPVWVARPNDPWLTTSRNSLAWEGTGSTGLRQFASNVPAYAMRPSIGAVTATVGTVKVEILGTCPHLGRLLVRYDDAGDGSLTGVQSVRPADIDTWDEVVEMSTTEPMATYITALGSNMIADYSAVSGDYLILSCRNVSVTVDGSAEKMTLWRGKWNGTDAYENWERCKFDNGTNFGSPFGTWLVLHQGDDFNSPYLACGEYAGAGNSYVGGGRVFFSEDNGLTWSVINTPWDAAAVAAIGAGTLHVHRALPNNSGTRVAVSWGDASSGFADWWSMVDVFERPTGWVPGGGAWTKTQVATRGTVSEFIWDGDYLITDNHVPHTGTLGPVGGVLSHRIKTTAPYTVESNIQCIAQNLGCNTSVVNGTVTVDADTEVFTFAGHGLSLGSRVRFSSTTTLPDGLAANTTYWVKTVPSANTFTIAATYNYAEASTKGVDDTGTGTHTCHPYQYGPYEIGAGLYSPTGIGMTHGEGLYWMSCSYYADLLYAYANSAQRGVWVSPNGTDWVQVYRPSSDYRGVRDIRKPVGGYAYGMAYHISDTKNYIVQLSVPSVAMRPAWTISEAVSNVYDDYNATPAHADYPDLSSSENTYTPISATSYALFDSTADDTALTLTSNGFHGTKALTWAPNQSVDSKKNPQIRQVAGVNTPLDGVGTTDRVNMTMWTKALVDASLDPYRLPMGWGTYWGPLGTATPVSFSLIIENRYQLIWNNWTRQSKTYRQIGEMTSDGSYHLGLYWRGYPSANNPTNADINGITAVFDAMQVTSSSERFYTLSQPYTLPGTTRAAEYLRAPMTNCGTAWSIVWDWLPMEGWAMSIDEDDVDADGTGGVAGDISGQDIPIMSVVGIDGSHINVFYDFSEKKITAIDNGADDGAQAAAWEFHHFDRVRFVLTTDGSDSVLTINSPVGTETVTLSSVNLGTSPAFLLMGTLNTMADQGYGRIIGPAVYNSQLTGGDLHAVKMAAIPARGTSQRVVGAGQIEWGR